MKTYDIPVSNFTKVEMVIMRKKALEGCKVAPQFISNQMVVSMMYEKFHALDRKRNLSVKDVKNLLPISLTKKMVDVEEYYKMTHIDEDDTAIVARTASYKKFDQMVDEEYEKYIGKRHESGKGYATEELKQINDFVALKELSNQGSNCYDIVDILKEYFLEKDNSYGFALHTNNVLNYLGAGLASKVLEEMRTEKKPASNLEESIKETRLWAYGQAGLNPPKEK